MIDRIRMNRWGLKKQHLTAKSKGKNILEVVDDMIGLHATDPLSPYLSLYARLKHFNRQDLDEFWEGKKLLGKVRFVRKTVYVLPKENIPAAFAAIRSMLIPRADVYLTHLGLTHDEYLRLCQRILPLFKGRGLTAKEVKAELESVEHISPLLNLMCDQGSLIRGLQRAGWLSNLHTYYAMKDYFPDLDLDKITEEEARRYIVQQYLETFGPVTLEDVSWWTSFRKGEVKKILQQREKELCEVEISGLKGNYWMLKAERAHMESYREDIGEEVSLLPLLDPYLMGYKDRSRYLQPEYFPYIYDRGGNATSTILVNGEVKGVWDYKSGKGRSLKMHWFQEPGERILDITRNKAMELGEFIFGGDLEICCCRLMTPLSQRTLGGFMSPLKDNK